MAERVITIHGLGGFPKTMKRFDNAFRREGYLVDSIGYNARYKTFKETADLVRRKINAIVGPHDRVHFVCHSLGGVLIRAVLGEEGGIDAVYPGRIVTLGSPHRGATWIEDVMAGHFVGHKVFGINIVEDLCNIDYFTKELYQLTPHDVLCISGTKEISLWNPLSWYVGPSIGPSDGFVPVEGTVLPNAHSLELDTDHLGMINNGEVIKTVLHFVNTGEVLHE